jgi:hypothetical protein
VLWPTSGTKNLAMKDTELSSSMHVRNSPDIDFDMNNAYSDDDRTAESASLLAGSTSSCPTEEKEVMVRREGM